MPSSALKILLAPLAASGALAGSLPAQDPGKPAAGSTDAFISSVDTSTLRGKVMVGYNGWYNFDGDGGNRGWAHWTKNPAEPLAEENISVELFPDLSEFAPDERFATDLLRPDGTPVEIYSSLHKETVKRHFQWMRDYQIDGAFIKRYGRDLFSANSRHHTNTVLANAQNGAAAAGRSIAVAYDLNGMCAGEVKHLIDDWKHLSEIKKITENATYLHHEGKPLVAVWGVGFADRHYTLTECEKLISFLKQQGCAVLVGTSSEWRKRNEHGELNTALLDLLAQVDVISPWTVGVYQSPKEARIHGRHIWKAEKAWCDARGIDHLPVIFPGFSRGAYYREMQNIVPRQHGKLLWAQFTAARRLGSEMVYVASFDGMNNGTAILKFDKTTPHLEGVHGISYENIPTDYYLKLTGEGGRLIKNEIVRRAGFREFATQYSSLD